jgi:hypothetical protein
LQCNKQRQLRKVLKVLENVQESGKAQTEMAGRCREWLTWAQIEEMEGKDK